MPDIFDTLTTPATSMPAPVAPTGDLFDQVHAELTGTNAPNVNAMESSFMRAKREQNESNPLTNYAAGVGQTLGHLGSGLVGTIAPETAQQMNRNIDAYYGPNMGGVSGFAGQAVGTVAETIPALATGLAAPAVMAGQFGAQGFGETRTEVADLRDQGKDISLGAELGTAAGIGAFDAASGFVGGKLQGLFGAAAEGIAPGLMKALKTEGVQGAKTFLARNAARLGQLGATAVAEGGEEGANQFADNVLKHIGINPDQDLSEGVAASALMGAGLAPILGPIAHGLSGHVSSSGETPQTNETNPETGLRPLPEQDNPLGPVTAKGDVPLTPQQQAGQDIKQAFGTIKGAARAGYVDTMWSKVQANEPIDRMGGNPKSLENRLRDAQKAGLLKTRSDIEQLVDGVYGSRSQPDNSGATNTSLADMGDAQGQYSKDEVIKYVGGMESKDGAELLGSMIGDGPFVVAEVPLDKINVNTLGTEADVNQKKLSIAGDLAKRGSVPPPVVLGPDLTIADGTHRVLMARAGGKQTIGAVLSLDQAKALGVSPLNVKGVAQQQAKSVPTAPKIAAAPPPSLVPVTASNVQMAAPSSKSAGTGRPSEQTNLWRRALKLPVDLVRNIPDESPLGKLRDTLGEGLIHDFKRPEEWSEGKTKARGRTNLVRHDIETLVHKFNSDLKTAGLNPDDPNLHVMVEQAVRGKMDISALPEAAQAWAQMARGQQDEASQRAAQVYRAVGMEKKAQIYEQNIGSYLQNVPVRTISTVGKARRAIARAIGLQTSQGFNKFKRDKWVLVNGGKVVGKFDNATAAKQAYSDLIDQKRVAITRKDSRRFIEPDDLKKTAAKGVELLEPISDEWRQEHEVHDPRFLIAKSIMETRHDAEMVKLFHTAAKEWGQVPPENLEGAEIDEWAKENDLEKLPASGRFHELKGLHVPKRIAADLMEMTRIPGTIEKIYRAYISEWKLAKTVLNAPASYVRDAIGSVFFSMTAGTSITNPLNAKHYKEAAKSLRAKDQDYRDLVEAGVLGSEYYGGEIRRIERAAQGIEAGKMDHALGLYRGVREKLGSVYSLSDQWYKLAAYKRYRADGMSKVDAAAEVNRFFPNYADVSKWSRIARNSPIGAPFISFLDQSMRIAGRTVRDRPLRVAMIAALPGAMSMLSALMAGMGDDERKMMDKERGYFQPYLPVRDAKGRMQTLDMRYLIPLANDLLPDERNGSLMLSYAFSNPIATTAIEQLTGKQRFTGKEFLNKPGMTAWDKTKARISTAFDSLAPVPTWATYGQTRVRKAATGASDEFFANALLGVLSGLNVRAPYAAEKDVRNLARNMVAEGEVDRAMVLVETWNKSYKPGYLKNLSMEGIGRGTQSSARSQNKQAMTKAAEFILQDSREDAEAAIKEYNDGRTPNSPELTMEQVEAMAERFRSEGKVR